MKTHLQIVALSAMAVLLTAGAASAYVYGWDPAKAPLGGNNSMYMELAQDPTYITSGLYAGKYEYFFDCYNVNTTFYFLHLTGLDNSKIANAQTIRPDAGLFKTQRWGDPNGNYEAWPAATGRLLDFWSKGRNDDLGSATAFDVSRTSYDDGSGGWTDSGLGYVGSSTDNPHAYGEYVNFSGWSSREIWKAELTGPGQPLHWWNTQFGVVPAQDTIYLAGSTTWASPGAAGLVLTLRVVYDEPIDPLTIGWGGDADMAFDVLGNFDFLGDFDGDYVVNDIDIDMMGDAIRLGSVDFATFDISADGTTSGQDGVIDSKDLDYLIRSLVFTSVGLGSEYGDFNLDGLVDTTDLTRLATFYGVGDTWAEGNANRNFDLLTDTTDLTILSTFYGFVAPDAIPEPMTLSLLALGGAALLRRRK